MRRRLLLVPLLGVLSLAACGDDRLSKSEYEQKLQSEYADVQQAFQATAASFGQTDLADTIGDAQKQLRDAAESLEHIEPPKDVEDENEEIVEGLREYADDLNDIREAADRNDLKTITAFTDRIADNEAIHQIAEAAEEMKHKGYEVGAIGEE